MRPSRWGVWLPIHALVFLLSCLLLGRLTIRDLYERPTITVPEAAQVLSCSERLAYEMARRGDLPVVRISEHRMVVVTQQLLAMLGITPPSAHPDVSVPASEERSLDVPAAITG